MINKRRLMDNYSIGTSRLTRRDFIKIAGGSLALLGISQTLKPKAVLAVEAAAVKPPVIWLSGQGCTGCTESFLNSLEPPATSILLNTISLRYHETAMAASGHLADEVLSKTIQEGGYLLVIEGSIPLAQDGLFCVVGGKPFKDIVREAASKAAAIICVGSCASYGGIPRSGPTDAVGYLFRGTQLHHYYDDVTGNTPVINLPTCPLHCERLVAVIIHYLSFGTVTPMDIFNRPLAFYSYVQHENCERRGHFEAGRFLTDWGNPEQASYCLYLKGCRGPWAHQDCWRRLWNSRANYCIRGNVPCVACSQPEFYEAFSPLYVRQFDVTLPGVGRVDIDKVMATVAGVAAASIGLHMLVGKFVEKAKGDTHQAAEKGKEY
jgi:hydrogenase small subunit